MLSDWYILLLSGFSETFGVHSSVRQDTDQRAAVLTGSLCSYRSPCWVSSLNSWNPMRKGSFPDSSSDTANLSSWPSTRAKGEQSTSCLLPFTSLHIISSPSALMFVQSPVCTPAQRSFSLMHIRELNPQGFSVRYRLRSTELLRSQRQHVPHLAADIYSKGVCNPITQLCLFIVRRDVTRWYPDVQMNLFCSDFEFFPSLLKIHAQHPVCLSTEASSFKLKEVNPEEKQIPH